ncbi:MAG: hypothetical protein KIT43_10350 [Bauldia sp.]|nr:hypothetical protein [Bauldia sp.]
MAFGDLFDGYCVLHAPFATAHRRPQFERELLRIGVTRFQIVEARRVPPDEPDAAPFKSPAELSLLDAFASAIRLARDSGWGSVAIFEDDVIFRRRFTRRWAQVEDAVRNTPWDVLTLHRWSWKDQITIERLLARTSLVPIRWTLCAHALVIRAQGYDKVLLALTECREAGRPADFFVGRLTRSGGVLLATSHNLAGQTSHLGGSTIQGGETKRRRLRYDFLTRFGSYRSRLEFWAVRAGRGVLRFSRGLTGRAQR